MSQDREDAAKGAATLKTARSAFPYRGFFCRRDVSCGRTEKRLPVFWHRGGFGYRRHKGERGSLFLCGRRLTECSAEGGFVDGKAFQQFLIGNGHGGGSKDGAALFKTEQAGQQRLPQCEKSVHFSRGRNVEGQTP